MNTATPPAIDQQLLDILLFCMQQIVQVLDDPSTKDTQFVLAFWRGAAGTATANTVYGASSLPNESIVALENILARLKGQVASGMQEEFEKTKAMMEAKNEPRH